MAESSNWFLEELERRGVSRRDFLGFCGVMTSVLALPKSVGAQIAEAIETKEKPTLVWLEFQDCAGNSESFLRAGRPNVADIVLDVLSIDYHETIMAAAGHQAEEALAKVVEEKPGAYIVVVEGSIPTGANGVYCTVGGRAAVDIAREVCGGAAATIAIGTCAAFGGLPAAAPNPTGALSVADAVPGLKNLINLPGLSGERRESGGVGGLLPDLQALPGPRPVSSAALRLRQVDPRQLRAPRAHFDAGQYVEEWGDEGHRTGYCLYKMGCKGPVTYQNCPNIRWNENTNWPIGSGHPCIGCAEPDFWDKMTPFYSHLDGFPGFGLHSNVDKVGILATAGVAAAFAAHGFVQLRKRYVHWQAGGSRCRTSSRCAGQAASAVEEKGDQS